MVTFILIGYKGFDVAAYQISGADIKWLIVLGTICTAFAFIVSVEVMKRITPYSVTMSVNLEPIYSIVLAILIWPESETMSYGFYMGTIIVLATIFLNGYFKGKEKKLNS